MGRNVNEMFASNGGVVVIDGFAINLTTTPHPSIDDLFEFNVEILYMIDASTRNLNVTCATATVSNMISIVANSKYNAASNGEVFIPINYCNY